MPESLLKIADEDVPARHPLYLFHAQIVSAVLAAPEGVNALGCLKPNSAFYEAEGSNGVRALEWLVEFIHDIAPEIVVIDDGKRGDIGRTSGKYGEGIFDRMRFDALTVHNYTGQEGLWPLLDNPDRLFFVLARTSNRGAGEFQDLYVTPNHGVPAVIPLWQYIATRVADVWNSPHGNCGLVVGATYHEDLEKIRREFGPEIPILAPGLGAQGGNLVLASRAGVGHTTFNNATEIIYASSGDDFAEVARERVIAMNDALLAARVN